MKLLIPMLFLIPTLAFASTGNKQNEAQAVLSSPEIAALLKAETKFHGLVCEKETLQDVSLKADQDVDDFEVIYGCNNPKGADGYRIHFTGVAYTVDNTAGATVLGMQIEGME